MKPTKQEALREWLDANPGKTEKDYLLEVRCPDDYTRQAVINLLEALDANEIDYGLFVIVTNYTKEYQKAPLNELDSECFDIMIAPGIGRNSWLIEVDMPDSVLGKQIENKSKTDSIPEEAFIWLLNKWFPDFDIESIDAKHYHKLMWEDMGYFTGRVIGERGFPQWKKPEFAQQVVETYLRDKNSCRN